MKAYSMDLRETAVAACDCGWQNRVPWLPGMYRFQDTAIEHHWRENET